MARLAAGRGRVTLDPLIQAVRGHAQSFGDLRDRMAMLLDLAHRLAPKLLGKPFAHLHLLSPHCSDQKCLLKSGNSSLWSVDMFRCESLILNSHWVMVVMDHYTRRIIGFAVHAGALDGLAVCRMFNRITAGHPKPL